MDDTYYTSTGGKIPVKWTAPEVMIFIDLLFNHKNSIVGSVVQEVLDRQ